jgi:hypothetical protein
VSAAALNGILNVEHTLLADTDESNGLLYAGEYVFYNCSALVNNETGSYAALLEEINDCGRAAAVNFLVAGEGKVNIIFGNEALADKSLSCLKSAVKSSLGIKSTASPENAVFNDALKCGLFPILFNHGNYVKMRHKNGGRVRAFALPMKEDGTVCGILRLADFVNAREKGGKKSLEALKLAVVLVFSVAIGDGLAFNHLGKVVGRLIAVNKYRLNLFVCRRCGLEAKGADKKYRYADKEQKENSSKYD